MPGFICMELLRVALAHFISRPQIDLNRLFTRREANSCEGGRVQKRNVILFNTTVQNYSSPFRRLYFKVDATPEADDQYAEEHLFQKREIGARH